MESFDDGSVAVTSTSKLALLDAEEGAWEEEEEAEAETRRRDRTTKNARMGLIHSCFGVADVTQDYLAGTEGEA